MGLNEIRLLLPDQPSDLADGKGLHGKKGNVPLPQGLPDGTVGAAVDHVDLALEHGNDLADHILCSAEGVSGQKMQNFLLGFHNFSLSKPTFS